jgi:hypothetical protein
MNLEWAIKQLEQHGAAIERLVLAVTPEQARVRPTPEDWSILEVINHLYDEEREDFRQRIDLTLHQPGVEWPPIHPGEWITSRAYQQRDLAESAANFAAERARSLAWLRTLAGADWDTSRTHPAGFELRAGDLLAAWVAHDVLHLRQLTELHYHLCATLAAPYSVEYAGDW